MNSQRINTRSSPYGAQRPSHAKTGLQVHTTSVPVAKNYYIQPQPAKTTDVGKNETLIEGHEIFADAIGYEDFTTRGYNFNPGLAIYERLSQLALAYEKYKVRKLEVVYVPTKALVVTPGAIYLTAEYDPSESEPTTMNALSAYETTASGRAFEMVRLNIPARRMFDDVKAKRTRCGPVTGDLQLYDACKIIVSSIGSGDYGGTSWGQLWVYYEIVLISPQVEPKARKALNIAMYNGTFQQTWSNAVREAVMFYYLNTLSGLNIAPNAQGDTFTPPSGMYRISGTLNMWTASSFTHQGVVELWKNGQPIPNYEPIQISTQFASATSETSQVSYDWLLDCNGKDSFSIMATVTGTTAVGILANGTTLVVTVV